MVAVQSAYLQFGDDPVFRLEAPVVSFLCRYAQIVAGVLIFCDKAGVVKNQIGFQNVGVLEQITHAHSGGNIIAFIVSGILDETDLRIFIQQLVKLLSQISSYDHDILDSGGKDGVQKRINHTGLP